MAGRQQEQAIRNQTAELERQLHQRVEVERKGIRQHFEQRVGELELRAQMSLVQVKNSASQRMQELDQE